MDRDDSICFLLGNAPKQIRCTEPSMTVLQYLRQKERMTGTKEGCAEGDCGACTVVIGSLEQGAIRYEAVNSCIMFLPFLHGKQLIAVEHLCDRDGTMHPVQQAMVDEHGSQCGFCTPGFVMSMFAMVHNRVKPDKASVDNAIAGNLCRCTGYVPIVRAARSVLSAQIHDKFDQREDETIEQLRSLNASKSVRAGSEGKLYFSPSTTNELAQILAQRPNSRIVAGATDVGLWVTKQGRSLGTIVYIGAIDSLKQVTVENAAIRMGAGVSVSRAMDVISQHYPSMKQLFDRYGSVQIRNLATIGGNVANGSPIGDSLPALVALDAKLAIESASGSREISAEEFFIDYGVQDLHRGEFLSQIIIPLPIARQQFRIYKLSKRYHQDISAVCGAFSIVSEQTRKIKSARVCFGGMAPTPRRAFQCEQALVRYGLTQKGIDAAKRALQEDYTPISDFRGSDAYRMHAAGSLVEKFVNEISSAGKQSVWENLHA